MLKSIHEISISQIKLNGRHRKDLGDIESLCASIEEVGLMHPVVLRPDSTLVAGERRLTAFKKLGRKTIPALKVDSLSDVLKALKAERDENTCRKDYLPSEAVSVGKAIELVEAPAAKERQKDGARSGGKASGKLPEASTGQTRDKVGAAIGMSGKQYEKAKAVMKAAEEKPAKFKKFVQLMDEKSVDAAYRGVQLEKTREALGHIKELPSIEDSDAIRAILNDPTADAIAFIRHLHTFSCDVKENDYEKINFELAEWRESFFQMNYRLITKDMPRLQKALAEALEKVRRSRQWNIKE